MTSLSMDETPPSPQPLLDVEQLEPFIEIGLEDFLDIFNDVVTEVPSSLELLRNAVCAADATAFKARCHSLRGMVANFGCIALAKGIAHYEKQPAIPAPEDAEAMHEELNDLWQRSHTAIKEWQKSIPNG